MHILHLFDAINGYPYNFTSIIFCVSITVRDYIEENAT